MPVFLPKETILFPLPLTAFVAADRHYGQQYHHMSTLSLAELYARRHTLVAELTTLDRMIETETIGYCQPGERRTAGDKYRHYIAVFITGRHTARHTVQRRNNPNTLRVHIHNANKALKKAGFPLKSKQSTRKGTACGQSEHDIIVIIG
ncbi:MAG: hypothetical protein LBH00_05120 [Planctomycetaceae bacterium]|nr:hypothetical protein [Planctomycetaceae bacterium]